jgi:hypothetical protein
MPLRPTTDLQASRAGVQADTLPTMMLTEACTGRSVELLGAVLEAQFRLDEGYLVLLTEDTPFEEALHVHYLDDALQLRDSLELSAPYTPGLLGNVRITPADELEFSFFGKTDTWTLTVLAQPARLLWGNRPPVTRTRPLLRQVWLKLNAGT